MVKKPIRKVKVIVSMPGYRIEGMIHVWEGERITDFLNSQKKTFIALTDAKVYDWQGEFIEDKKFMSVNRNRIAWMAEA